MKEKKYNFNVCRSGLIGDNTDVKIVTFGESEIDAYHTDLLLGELISRWDRSPGGVRERFLEYLELPVTK